MSQTVIVKGVKAYWPKLIKPVSPFGTEQYELQVRADEKSDAAKQLKELGLKAKPQDDGVVAFNLKRRAQKRDGTPNNKPDVVDAQRRDFDPSLIGNGTGVNVKLFTYDYDFNGRKGTGVMLSGVQVVDLVEYKNSSEEDFDTLEGEEGDF